MKFLLFIITLIAFISVGGFGFMHAYQVSEHDHHPRCPFMIGQEAICYMTALDHMSLWQKAFTTTLPSLTLLFALIGLAFILVSLDYYKPPNVVRILGYYLRNRSFAVPTLYQQLFSKGILNPKTF